MSDFPGSNFTIVNNDTGRCVRVRLGRTKDVSDWKEGTKYLLSVTEKPTLELGTADNSPATVWSFSTSEDGEERQPFNQIVNFAVSEYQNIGRYCVWMDTDSSADYHDRKYSEELYQTRLDDLPADLRTKLGALIPEEWNTWFAGVHSESLERWKRENFLPAGVRARMVAEQEAWAADKEPLSTEQLAQLKAIREQEIDYAEEKVRRQQAEKQGRRPYAEDEEEPQWAKEEAALLNEVGQGPRGERVRARIRELSNAEFKRWIAAVDLEWQRRTPVAALEFWHTQCANLAFHDNGVVSYDTGDGKITAAVRAYIDAAAKEGIKPSIVSRAGASTRMHGTGARRSKGSTYRWVFDGTHIYGADSKTVPSERTYWTDQDGVLVGKSKGGSGQTWTVAPWKPSPKAPDPARAIILTGLFGPLGVALGDALGI
ncbi:hypothetical protein [Streptomyces sp. NPDC057748]|uniref:hypothetical protein n=1 Tax=unclassified Streptomyces TaxID=2593676 RepID=UPI0036BC972A